MYEHASVLDAEIYPEMVRNRSKVVPVGNGPIIHHDKFVSDQPTMADLYQMIIERFDEPYKQFDKLTENMRVTNQRFASLEHKARQQRLATETDVEPDTKTRKRKGSPLQQLE